MNNWLLRLLKQATKRIRPTLSALIIRTIAEKVKGVRNHQTLGRKIKMFARHMALTLRRYGQQTEETISQFVNTVTVLGELWEFVFGELWRASRQPVMLLLNWLESSLRNSQVPEKIDLVFEEVRYYILKKHWPPARQRCDSIAPAI